ncbi:MAG: hypothetical protein JXP73_10100 [Deltaproteobacteria bacterium]|jgi:hypothetical protein|nr:hypothetical protein [Deltaproteobacteria bacterium]
MRGPLLSGALGSPATLDRVRNLVGERSPIVVLSALWLAETLATELPVLALVEEEKRNAAARAQRRARKHGYPLTLVVAASELPLGPRTVGAFLVDNLVDIEEKSAAVDLLLGLLPALKPNGIVLSLDPTKSPALEARMAECFLAANLAHITQLRPRDGALLTAGQAPHPAIVAARLRSFASTR